MKKSIITVEDNLIVAEDLKDKLEGLGYEVLGNFLDPQEILHILNQRTVDLLIVDILLGQDKTGIDIVKEIYEHHQVPIVYLTANSESTMVKMAMETHPSAYLIKPFKLSEFTINIDLAIKNFEKRTSPQESTFDGFTILKDAIFIPDNQMHIRINNKDIYAVEADGAYIKILTKDRNYQLASNLKNFVRQFNDSAFIRISRKHLINTNLVQKINGNTIHLGHYEFQFPRQSRQEILSYFKILKTK
jgi:DNA-binding LytR/AlgR family response regulator